MIVLKVVPADKLGYTWSLRPQLQVQPLQPRLFTIHLSIPNSLPSQLQWQSSWSPCHKSGLRG